MKLPITYEYKDGRCYASAHLPNGETVTTSVPTAPIVRDVMTNDRVGAAHVLDEIGFDVDIVGGVDIVGAVDAVCGALDDELDAEEEEKALRDLMGVDGFDEVSGRRSRRRRRRARRKRRRARRRARLKRFVKRGARFAKKALKKTGQIVKKVAKSKLGKIVGQIIRKIPIYGQAFDLAVKAGKGIAKGVRTAKRLRRKLGGRKLRKMQRVARGLLAAKKGKRLTKRGVAKLALRSRRKIAAKPSRRPTKRRAAPARARSRARRGAGLTRRLRAGTYRVQLPTGGVAEVKL